MGKRIARAAEDGEENCDDGAESQSAECQEQDNHPPDAGAADSAEQCVHSPADEDVEEDQQRKDGRD